jgi:hypothetical protein
VHRSRLPHRNRRTRRDWHELAAIWRVRAKSAGRNVISQPFASRSSAAGVRQR